MGPGSPIPWSWPHALSLLSNEWDLEVPSLKHDWTLPGRCFYLRLASPAFRHSDIYWSHAIVSEWPAFDHGSRAGLHHRLPAGMVVGILATIHKFDSSSCRLAQNTLIIPYIPNIWRTYLTPSSQKYKQGKSPAKSPCMVHHQIPIQCITKHSFSASQTSQILPSTKYKYLWHRKGWTEHVETKSKGGLFYLPCRRRFS